MNWPPEYHSDRGSADELADALSARIAEYEDSAIVVCCGRPGEPCGVLLGCYCAAGHDSRFGTPIPTEVAEMWCASEPVCHCGRAVNTRSQSHGLCPTCSQAACAELAALDA
jgi:hypothetical protein